VNPIVAAGTVLWRFDDRGELELALVHRPKYGDWSLPKGKTEPGEHFISTAVRETQEETGFTGPVGRPLGHITYSVHSSQGPVPKTVHYFAMAAIGGAFTASAEVDRLVWLHPPAASARLSRTEDRDVLVRFASLPSESVTILLVRHGHAGERKRWHGDDAERPLDGAGHAQAQLLAGIGPCFGVQGVYAARVLRCMQTLAPLAAVLGMPVEPEPDFTEAGVKAGDAALKALERVVALGRHAAICSQGGVIPELLTSLAARDAAALPSVRSRKGSVWVLSFAYGRLIDGSYLADLSPTW